VGRFRPRRGRLDGAFRAQRRHQNCNSASSRQVGKCVGRKARNAVISQYFQLFGGRGVLSTPLKMLTFTWCWPLKPRFRLRPFETTVGLRLKARICRNPACACRAAVTCRAPQRAQIVRPRRKFGEVPDDLIANHEPCGARTIEPGIGTDLPRPTVVGATAELHTEGKALRFGIVAGKPVRGNARCAREPFPAARSVS
jgi:hypothetical protein